MKRFISLPFALTMAVLLFGSFLAQSTTPTTLTVNVIGEGSVRVQGSSANKNGNSQIDAVCTPTLPCEYPSDTYNYIFTLTATPQPGWEFTGFTTVPDVQTNLPSKTASGSPFTFLMDTENVVVTANFSRVVPVANWAIILGIGLILAFLAFRFRRLLV